MSSGQMIETVLNFLILKTKLNFINYSQSCKQLFWHIRNGNLRPATVSVFFTIRLYQLSKLQIFIDSSVFLTDNRNSVELCNIENQIEIDQLQPELSTVVQPLTKRECAAGNGDRLFFFKFALAVKTSDIYRSTRLFDR